MTEGTDAPDDQSTRTCSACRGAVGAGERYCRHCGAPVGDEAVVAPASGHATTTALPAVASTSPAPPPSAAAGPDQRICPGCGAANSPQRELCGRCGVDLDTGIEPPWLAGSFAADREPVNGREPAHHRWWLIVLVAVVAVISLVVGGLAIAGVGPFERTPELPGVTFDAEWYVGEPEFLLLSDIATLTTHPPEGGDTFTPTQMVDDDRETAWRSDGSQFADGVGEKIDLFLAEPGWVAQIVIANGNQADADTYADSARMKRAMVAFDGGYAVVVNLLDQGLQQQAVELPEPVLTTSIRIEVLETFPGDTHADLAVSDLELRGWPADDQDARVAGERADLKPAAGTVAVVPESSDAGGSSAG